MRPLTRVTPKLPAHAMKTYGIATPAATHFRSASCAEVDCDAWTSGWRTVVDESTPLGQQQAHYIRTECRPVDADLAAHLGHGRVRRYIEASEDGRTVFTFPPGQECFTDHQVRLERPALYVVRGGDWRGNPRRTATLRHATADAWVDDFATHQDRLAAAQHRG